MILQSNYMDKMTFPKEFRDSILIEIIEDKIIINITVRIWSGKALVKMNTQWTREYHTQQAKSLYQCL